MTDRLAALEVQAAALNVEIAKLRAEQPPPPRPPRDEFRVVALNDEITTGMPSLAEMRRLFSIVRQRVPEQKSHDPDAAFRGFCCAFRFVSNCGRVAAPNGKVSISWWMEGMTAWLRERNAMTIDVSGSSFIAAVVASGDVLFVPHNSTLGYTWEFSLVAPGHGGKPASDAWKRVLEGSLLAPSQPARQVRIVSGY
jgi:hypothetical protein